MKAVDASRPATARSIPALSRCFLQPCALLRRKGLRLQILTYEIFFAMVQGSACRRCQTWAAQCLQGCCTKFPGLQHPTKS